MGTRHAALHLPHVNCITGLAGTMLRVHMVDMHASNQIKLMAHLPHVCGITSATRVKQFALNLYSTGGETDNTLLLCTLQCTSIMSEGAIK